MTAVEKTDVLLDALFALQKHERDRAITRRTLLREALNVSIDVSNSVRAELIELGDMKT